MSIPVLLDCDPGHDDAIAILLALASPEVELLGITTVAGNASLENTTANALRVLEVAGRTDITVAAGAERPLVRPLRMAAEVHGEGGLEGPKLAAPTTRPAAGHAVDFMAERILGHHSPVTLVPTGPLTNVALLLAHHPRVLERLERIVLMGGSVGLGNTTPAAEFNIWSDPEAARRVFESGADMTMIGLDVTHQALIGPTHVDKLRETGRCGRFVADLIDFFAIHHRRVYGFEGAPIHDAVAVAHVIAPGLVTARRYHVDVDCESVLSRGRTLVDRWGVTGQPPNAWVGESIDPEAFAQLLVERIGGLP
jgi:inosine-uridine nucleoside N-ribohydrolase